MKPDSQIKRQHVPEDINFYVTKLNSVALVRERTSNRAGYYSGD